MRMLRLAKYSHFGNYNKLHFILFFLEVSYNKRNNNNNRERE